MTGGLHNPPLSFNYSISLHPDRINNSGGSPPKFDQMKLIMLTKKFQSNTCNQSEYSAKSGLSCETTADSPDLLWDHWIANLGTCLTIQGLTPYLIFFEKIVHILASISFNHLGVLSLGEKMKCWKLQHPQNVVVGRFLPDRSIWWLDIQLTIRNHQSFGGFRPVDRF
jgi:hypothetical protein